jgi:hypothetical protein
MIENSKFDLDNYAFEKVRFEEFLGSFRQMLVQMRTNKDTFLNTSLNYFEFKLNKYGLSLNNIQEDNIFEIIKRYENFVESSFINDSYELELRDGMVDAHHDTEILDQVSVPWFSVGIFNEELDRARIELLACKVLACETANYWRLSESVTSSPNNIPDEFRLIANKLRASINS